MQLEEEGLEFEYEPYSITLVPPFTSSIDSWEMRAKKFKPIGYKQQKMGYTPDFVGNGWLMEVKGQRRADFNIRWKLLKKLLTDNNVDIVLFMPRTFEQAKICIEEIKKIERGRSKSIPQFPENIKLVARSNRKPKTVLVEKKRVSKRGRKGLS